MVVSYKKIIYAPGLSIKGSNQKQTHKYAASTAFLTFWYILLIFKIHTSYKASNYSSTLTMIISCSSTYKPEKHNCHQNTTNKPCSKYSCCYPVTYKWQNKHVISCLIMYLAFDTEICHVYTIEIDTFVEGSEESCGSVKRKSWRLSFHF